MFEVLRDTRALKTVMETVLGAFFCGYEVPLGRLDFNESSQEFHPNNLLSHPTG